MKYELRKYPMGYATRDSSSPFSSHHSSEQESLKVFSADLPVALSSGYRL